MIPLVSIIIPTFNRVHLIGETLTSIKNRSYTNFECLIIDDGSTDASELLVLDYIKQDDKFQFYTRSNKQPKGA